MSAPAQQVLRPDQHPPRHRARKPSKGRRKEGREEEKERREEQRHCKTTALHRYGTTSLRHGYRRGPVRRAWVISQKKSTRRARYSTGLLHRRAPIVGGRSGPQGFLKNANLPARDKNQHCSICGSGCNSRRRSPEWSGERGLSETKLVSKCRRPAARREGRGGRRRTPPRSTFDHSFVWPRRRRHPVVVHFSCPSSLLADWDAPAGLCLTWRLPIAPRDYSMWTTWGVRSHVLPDCVPLRMRPKESHVTYIN